MNEPKANALDLGDHGRQVTVGRYILHREIARGGMATIHIARLMGDEGFSRIVAAKRLHPEFAEDAEFVAMFLDEARIASRVQHRNVVPVLDVVAAGTEVILVQEYVHGAPLHSLLKNMRQGNLHMPVNVAVAIACQVLAGLHATHETVDELGHPMHIVHRDVSPQNVMIALDGSARLLDFGVAKAVMAAHVTREGTYKGKLAYSAPEQLRGQATRQSDIYSLSVLLWELLVGERMHRSRGGAELVSAVINGEVPSVTDALCSAGAWDSLSGVERRQMQLLDPIVSRGLAVDTRERWMTAAEMEEALASAVRPAPARVLAAWVKAIGKDFLERREGVIAAEEASWRKYQPPSGARVSLPPTQRSVINAKLPAADALAAPALRSQFHPSASSRTRLALVAVVAVALAAGAALVASDGEPTSTPAPATVGATTAPPTALPAPTAEPPPTRASLAPAIQPPPSVPAAPPAVAPDARRSDELEDRAQRVVHRAAPEPRDKVERRARPVSSRPAPEPEPAPETASPQPTPKPSVDCDVPYYFEGSKKIFKPACL